MPKQDDLQWQAEYAAELKRTCGKTARFEMYSAGWWTLYIDEQPSFQRKRRAEVLKMTENLKQRPDHNAAASAN